MPTSSPERSTAHRTLTTRRTARIAQRRRRHADSVGAFLEVLLAISGIATAVVMCPILKRQSQSISLGYVACRTVESTIIVVGIVSVLSVLATFLLGPRRMALLGLIGGPLRVVGATFVLFGAWEQTSATQFIFALPEIL
jgi:Domain of unknown function (DUF4386)